MTLREATPRRPRQCAAQRPNSSGSRSPHVQNVSWPQRSLRGRSDPRPIAFESWIGRLKVLLTVSHGDKISRANPSIGLLRQHLAFDFGQFGRRKPICRSRRGARVRPSAARPLPAASGRECRTSCAARSARRSRRARDISSRSNTLAASFGFMPSYMVMMPLKRAASVSAFCPVAVVIRASRAFISSTTSLDALLGRLQQALADLDLARALLQFLPPRLQPLQNGALRCRHRGWSDRERRTMPSGFAASAAAARPASAPLPFSSLACRPC